MYLQTPASADRRLTARAVAALLIANIRYWTRVAPLVRSQLRRWRASALAIGDPDLRALALQSLHNEGFTAEAAALIATRAPRAHRKPAVEAIVALEVMYDYLDGLVETPQPDLEARELFTSLTDAFARASGSNLSVRPDGSPQRDIYLQQLVDAVREGLAELPGTDAIRTTAQTSAARAAEAQFRLHEHSPKDPAAVELWASQQAAPTGLAWREFLAGAAASVLVLHALIAAAADPDTTARQAASLDAVYLSIAGLSTMLDSLIDYEEDLASGAARFVERYESRADFAAELTGLARRTAGQAGALPDGAHHLMMLVGVVAYYTSTPPARGKLARPIVKSLHGELGALIVPTLMVMRTWRLARRIRDSWRLTAARATAED